MDLTTPSARHFPRFCPRRERLLPSRAFLKLESNQRQEHMAMKRSRCWLTVLAFAYALTAYEALAASDPMEEIEKLEKRVKKASDLIRARLPAAARPMFDAAGTLPTDDKFVTNIQPQIKELQKVLHVADAKRGQLDRKSLQGNGQEIARLDDIDRQVAKVLGGRERFAGRHQWSGSMQYNGNAYQITVEIDQGTGDTFSGTYAETSRGGRPAKLQVSGSMEGSTIQFATGQVLLGAFRSRSGSGWVFRDRIVADVVVTEKGKKGPIQYQGRIELTCNSKKNN